MKPKFLLAILALNTLFLGGINPEYNIAKLSQTIAKLVGFDGADPNLVKSAIERALKAKEKAVHLESRTAGAVSAQPEIQKPTQTPIKKDKGNIDL
jgi:hypothetical protein